jgi:murein DD-endopeptidase MepM/ murein hydrolase activator NlpD
VRAQRRRPGRRRLTSTGAALAIGSLGVAGLLAPAPPAQATDTTIGSEAGRAQQIADAISAARSLDPGAAPSEQLVTALTVLDQYIQTRLAHSAEAERAQQDAERRLSEHIRDLEALQPAVQRLTNSLRSRAVHLYLDPAGSDASIRLLKAETIDDAQQRRVLGDAVSGNTGELVAELRRVRPKRDALQSQAVAARDEAAARKADREKVFTEVLGLQETQGRLQKEWDRRVANPPRSGEGELNRDALARAIAEQRAKPAPKPPAPPPSTGGQMMWPASGGVTSPFGWRSGRPHEGIDIGAPHGAPVLAALAGRVVFAGWIAGYGNTLVIEHSNGLETQYAHLSAFSVRSGAVARGQRIASVGATGGNYAPHLHFEVHVNGVPRNPVNYLP